MLARTLQQPPAPAGTFPLLPAGEVFRTLGQPRHFRRNALLYAPGDPPAAAYLLASGEVKLSRYTPDGRELALDHLRPGALFGELEILLDTVRESQAAARTDVKVFALDRDALLESMESNAAFALWVMRHMSARQARMENRLETLLFKSANGKVAQVLRNLAVEHGRASREGTLIDYPITHQEIGNLVATTRETVSYAFMEFRRLGLISTRQRKTIVLDMDGLEDMALD